MKSFTRFYSKNRKGEGDRVPFSHSAECEISYDTKDQEGRPNSPVDCLAVGNPIKGFPKINRQIYRAKQFNGLFCREYSGYGRTAYAV